MPANGTQSERPQSKQDEFPTLNPSALSTLTERIESSFKDQEKRSKPTSRPATSETTKKSKGSKLSKVTDVQNAQIRHSARDKERENGNHKPKTLRQSAPTAKANTVQGKKRLRDGRIKASDLRRVGDDVNHTKLGVRGTAAVEVEGQDFDEDVRALGGTQDDINLVGDAPSDSEVEGTHWSGDDVTKETQQLIRQLGLDKLGQQAHFEDPPSDPEGGKGGIDHGFETQGNTSTSYSNGDNLDSLARKVVGRGQESLVFRPQSEWHTAELPTLPTVSLEATDLPKGLVERLYEHAKSLLDRENKQYAAHHTSASSAHQFYSTIMSTGTLSDKISALTLSVQESPVHNVKALESLVALARKRSRGQAVEVLGALKDLFGPGNLLPSDRKLRTFAGQPGLLVVLDPTDFQWTAQNPLPKHLQECHLIVWAYEHWLKGIYFEVLKIIEIWCNDEVVFARGKAVDYVCQLLKEKPEQEANLLRLLVNKLGDSDKKIASKASFLILQLETSHPLMKPTIIAAIESDLLFRPGQNLHAQYYAVITLNQTVLSGKEEGVAKSLLDIYFSLFMKLLENPKSGKALPIEQNKSILNKKGEVQGGGAAGGKKASKKLAEAEKSLAVYEDLREKMLSAVLTGVNRAVPFTTTDDESFERHVGTLFRVTHSSNFNTSIQALMLIQQLTGSHQGLVDRFYRTLYESLLDPRLLTSSKQALYLNLLFRALRSDLNIRRVKAFAKRLLQVVTMHQPAFTCAALYLLRELEGIFASLKAFMDQAEEEDDDEEHFQDVDENSTIIQSTPDVTAPPNESPSSKKPSNLKKYDGRKRDPEHSNASNASPWEITPFLKHYHPSVSLFAIRLLTHAPMPPKPDLSQNTLIHFLDRFVYRNAKATTTHKGSSIMQPLANADSSALLVSALSSKNKTRQPVNSEAFWKQGSGKVNADEVFFHKYFNVLGKGREKAKKKRDRKRRDAEGSESEGDEEEIWKALVDSRPEIDGGSDGGVFSEDDDLDSGTEDSDYVENLEEDAGSVGFNLEDDDDDDDAAILASDEDIPNESALDSDFEAEVQTGKSKKPPGKLEAPQLQEGGKCGTKRRKLKNLPTFASADEYARMVDGDDE